MNLAELYAKNNRNQYRDSEELIKEYSKKFEWNEDEKILDIGCGPGNTTAQIILPIIPKSAYLLGTDISEEMIRFAQEQYTNERLGFMTLDIGGENVAHGLGIEIFDKVFSFYCLHWIPDQRKSIENIWKLMKPNGMALLALVSNSPLFDLYKWLSEQDKWKEYMQDVNKFITPYQDEQNPSEIYRNLLETVGFQVSECYMKKVQVKVPNLQTLKESLKAVNPFLSRMQSVEIQNEYMETIMNAITDRRFVIPKNTTNGILSQEQELAYIKPNQLIIAFCRKN